MNFKWIASASIICRKNNKYFRKIYNTFEFDAMEFMQVVQIDRDGWIDAAQKLLSFIV